MSILSPLGPVSERIAASLAGRDSPLVRPYLASARALTNCFRQAYLADVCRFENAPEYDVLNLQSQTNGYCYSPQTLSDTTKESSSSVIFPPVRSISLRDLYVEPCSSSPYDRKRNCFYVDEHFQDAASYASNAGGHLAAHGLRKAIVHRNFAPAAIESGIFMGGNGSFNYYHWLVEIASKLQFISNLSEKIRHAPLLVSRRVREVAAFDQILQLLAPGSRTICLDEGKSYLVHDLTLIEPLVRAPFNLRGRHTFRAQQFLTRPEAVFYLRAAALEMSSSGGRKRWPERVFLARGKQRPYNQDELISIAARKGFEVVFPEQHTFMAQAGFFANARVLIGPTGAGWANLVFADPGCRALCWMPEELGEFAAFSNIAGILGMELRYLLYRSNVKCTQDVYRHSYRICPEAFERALDSIIGK